MSYYRRQPALSEYKLVKYTNRILADTDTAINQDELVAKSSKRFRCSATKAQLLINQAFQSGALIQCQNEHHTFVTTKKYNTQDQRLAKFLQKRAQMAKMPLMSATKFKTALAEFQEESNFQLDVDQQKVLHDLFVVGIRSMAVNGSAGTGKTSIVKAIVQLLERTPLANVYGAAVSGKASQKLGVAAGIPSSTLHSLFQIPVGFKRRRAIKPTFLATADVLIIDESSMLSSELFAKTILQLSAKTRLILLGDHKQLPPIDSGQPFRDILMNIMLPCYRLTHFHRAPTNSGITKLAQKIRHQQIPDLNDLQQDVTLLPAKTLPAIRSSVLCACTQLAASVESVFDWQMLSFTNVSPIGAIQMNMDIQALFDIGEDSAVFIKEQEKLTYRMQLSVGDKVIHEVNSVQQSCPIVVYQEHGFSGVRRELKNGTVGQIVNITEKYVFIKYPELDIVSRYTYRQIETSISLAWCLTVHKCQGSEFNHVILPITAQKAQLAVASNELLYSAVTRAQKSLTFIGTLDFFEELCCAQVRHVFSSLQHVNSTF